MIQEDKELLLRDLCARLPYGVMLNRSFPEHPFKLFSVTYDGLGWEINRKPNGTGNQTVFDFWDYNLDIPNCKPYLRPMSSMTKEETKEVDILYGGDNVILSDRELAIRLVNYYNSHHFDYHGLIEKGLALEAPNGMYKNKP